MKAVTINACINLKDVLNRIDLTPLRPVGNRREHEQTWVLLRTISPLMHLPQGLWKQPAEAGKTYSKGKKKAVKFLKLRNNSQPEWRIAANSRGCREAIPWAWNDSLGSILIPGKDGKEDRLMHPLRTERGRRKCQSPWCGFLPPWPKDRVHAYSCSFKMVDRFDSGCGYS